MLVRSPHAHATHPAGSIPHRRSQQPGVVAVLTGADMAADNVGPMAPLWAIKSARRQTDGRAAALARWRAARVRHVGEPVAIVVADSARWRATPPTIWCRWTMSRFLPCSMPRPRCAADAPLLHQAAPGNVCFRLARGDEAAVRKAFAVRGAYGALDLVNNRLIGAAIEPRAIVGRRPCDRTTHLYCSTPGAASRAPHGQPSSSNLPQSAMRLIAPDVGGGFGYKGKHLSRGNHHRLGGAAAAAGR